MASRLLPALVLTITLVGCGASEGEDIVSSPGTPSTETAEIRILVAPGDPADDYDSQAAEIGGTIVEASGCVFIDSDETERRRLPIWPRGTTVSGDTIVVHQSRVRDSEHPLELRIGDPVLGGGGYVDKEFEGEFRAAESIQDLGLPAEERDHALRCLDAADTLAFIDGL